MHIEEKIRDCKYNLKMIKHFNPDPHYVDFFLKKFLLEIISIYDEIFEKANIDFGLFVSEKCTKEKFKIKAIEKRDNLALEFLSWFEKYYTNEHINRYPNFVKKVLDFFLKYGKLPKITIKMLANPRYTDDMVQEIYVDTTNGRLRSKEFLQMEMKRQIPIFLELINQKRKKYDEPKVNTNQIVISSFLEIENYGDIEISYAFEIYLPVVIRILEESQNEIKRLTTYVN